MSILTKTFPTPLLTPAEIAAVITTLHRLANYDKRRRLWRNLLATFELVTCCGMNAADLVSCRVGQVRVEARPFHIELLDRIVPLDWCDLVAQDIAEHVRYRRAAGAADTDRLIVSQRTTGNGSSRSLGHAVTALQIRRFYATACRKGGIGGERGALHLGLNSFLDMAIAAGINREAVRNALGLRMPGEREGNTRSVVFRLDVLDMQKQDYHDKLMGDLCPKVYRNRIGKALGLPTVAGGE